MNTGDILARISGLRALVVGDICLDRWCRYDPATAEPSRETGIPRIGVVSTEVTPGAAGTVANNLKALGAAEVAVLGMIGDDGFGFELERALEDRSIATDWVVQAGGIPTFTYTKLINAVTDEEDLPRVDFIYTSPLPEEADSLIAGRLHTAWRHFDVVLVSDQAETAAGGVVTRLLRHAIAELEAETPGRVVWVDSRARPELFRNVILKCNSDEAEAAMRRAGTDDLLAHTSSRLVIVTHGARGAEVIEPETRSWVDTVPVERPVDICGAGDSFSAGAALALASGADPVRAARFGNLVASITIMKRGTGTASPEEVLEAAARLS